MQNPSQGVAQQLQPHVHLISAHRFPHIAAFGLDQVYRYLLDAPAIVKQHAPMAWHYVAVPQDGTVWLEWIPLEKLDAPYPSDGYIWADAEQTYRQDFNGYTMELKVHTVGYRPGQDQMATHARTRYHFVGKNPSINAAPPDPSLWLVHYRSANPSHIMPVSQVPVGPQIQNILAQRRWLESQGRLDRRDFMLHDTQHWPILNLPSHAQMQQAPPYGAATAQVHMNQSRYPAYPQHAGGPPAKKARTSAPGMPLQGSSDGAHDITLESEEDTAMGDFFDHLTQRDISMTRYMQHHRWMEEVFSSPYASNKIVPPDLGLGLMGELKGLTDGILDQPSLDFRNDAESKPARPREPPPFTNLKKEQIEEFEKRVAKHLEEGRAEIERMKAEHAAKMQDWKKVKALTQAEKRLRFATWEVREEELPAYRLEVEPAVRGQREEGLGKENIEHVIKEVESSLKVKITSHQDATRIARGGLTDRKQPFFDYNQQLVQQETTFENVTRQEIISSSLPGADSVGTGSATYHEDPAANTQPSGEQHVSKMTEQLVPPSFQAGSNQGTPSHPGNTPQAGGQETPGDMPAMDINEMMDMDVNESEINFGDHQGQDLGTDSGVAGSSNQGQQHAQQGNHPVTILPDPVSASSTETATLAASDPKQQAAPTQQTDGNAAAGESALGDLGIGDGNNETNMFHDTFGDLANIDGTGDNDLIDFEGGGMGLDDSEFGAALHGMDAADGSGSGNTPAVS